MIMGENKMRGFDLKASWLGHVTPEMYFDHTFKVPSQGFEDEEETIDYDEAIDVDDDQEEDDYKDLVVFDPDEEDSIDL